MGGPGTMVKWVTDTPVLGAKDYTHLNPRGAQKMASLLIEAIENKLKTP